MAVYKPHTLIQFSGRLSVNNTTGLAQYNDIWSCSIRGGTATGSNGPHADPVAFITALYTPLSAWFALTTNGLSQRATLDLLKVNNIDAGGHYSGGPTIEHVYTPGIVGGGAIASAEYPMFITLASTFLTNKARGRASRGRISLPMALATGTGSSSATSGTQTQLANTTAKLLDLLHTAGNTAGSSFVANVYSSIDGSASSIQSIRVGQRFDTINRRKNAVPEAPYATAVPAAPGPL